MIDVLARNPLFAGLDPSELGDLEAVMRRKEFDAGQVICHEGEAAESLFVIVDGFARVLHDDQPVARLRRGDVIGEMSLVSGEPRSATVVAAVPSTVFELSRYGVAALIAEQPRILENLTRILTDRLAATTARVADSRARGEAVTLAVSEEAASSLPDVIAATKAASPRPVAVLDVRDSLDALGEARRAPGEERHRRRRRVAGHEYGRGGHRPQRSRSTSRRRTSPGSGVTSPAPSSASRSAPGARRATRTSRRCACWRMPDTRSTTSRAPASARWSARGSRSARDSHEIEATMRESFTSDAIDELFKLSMTGGSTGLEAMARLLRETTDEKTFDDLVIPFVAMTVDLNARAPAPAPRARSGRRCSRPPRSPGCSRRRSRTGSGSWTGSRSSPFRPTPWPSWART